MKVAEIKELTVKELTARKRELKQEIFNLRVQQQAGQLERPHTLKTIRRDIARVDTLLTAKTNAATATNPTA